MASALATAVGIFLTPGLTGRLPVWQTVGPLLLFNSLWVVPFALAGDTWHVREPRVLAAHIVSAVVLALSTAAMFALIPRGSTAAVAVGQALSPAAAVVAAPLVLGTAVGHGAVVASCLVMVGAVWPMRGVFGWLHSGVALALMGGVALGAGLLTVLSARLALWNVGLTEIFVVRSTVAGLVYLLIFPPRDIPLAVVPALARRSLFVTLGFALAIAALRDGDVALVQSFAAMTPLFVVVLELIVNSEKPNRAVLVGAGIALVGATALAVIH